jgi:putative transposase
VQYITEAVEEGARMKRACAVVGISHRSFARWSSGKVNDARKGASKNIPRKLTHEEKEAFYHVATKAQFRDMTPCQIVATLLQEGFYYASESTLHRIFREKKANIHRRKTRTPRERTRPPELMATGANQIWSWDITWIKTDVAGIFLFAYVIIDVFSRKIVGWTIKDTESPEHARDLFARTILAEKALPKFVHADNGGPMRGITLQVFLTRLQVSLSYNRPRTSNDNPYSESWFGTMKTHVSYPSFFTSEEHARTWFARFIHLYNTVHLHSRIGYVTPVEKHTGKDIAILKRREETLQAAAARHPQRFVNGHKRIEPISEVYLNLRVKKPA